MEIIDTHYDMQAPAHKVWAFLENFADIQAWWPKGGEVDIDHVDLEGEGIGLVRHIYNVGFPNPVSERLDYLDPENRTLKLSIVGAKPAGIVQYQATGQIKELDANSCRMTYHAEFEAKEGEAEAARGFLLYAYDLMFKGLETAAQR